MCHRQNNRDLRGWVPILEEGSTVTRRIAATEKALVKGEVREAMLTAIQF